jgi:hypothetical protein
MDGLHLPLPAIILQLARQTDLRITYREIAMVGDPSAMVGVMVAFVLLALLVHLVICFFNSEFAHTFIHLSRAPFHRSRDSSAEPNVVTDRGYLRVSEIHACDLNNSTAHSSTTLPRARDGTTSLRGPIRQHPKRRRLPRLRRAYHR